MEGREGREGRDDRKKPYSKRFTGKFVKKKCRFCMQKVDFVDYKDVNLLNRYLTPSGKILGGRISGNCSRHQRMMTRAIKRARQLALVPFVVK